MAFTRIRTIKGRQYLFQEERWRENGKVRSRSKSLGPVGGRKKKIAWLASLLGGGLALGPHIVKYGTGSPRYRNRTNESGRTRQMREAKIAEIYRQFGVDMSSGQAMRATMALLTSEQWQDMWERQRAIGREAREQQRSPAKERAHREAVSALRNFEQRAAERAKAAETTVPPASTKSPEEKAREEYTALRADNRAQIAAYWAKAEETFAKNDKAAQEWTQERYPHLPSQSALGASTAPPAAPASEEPAGASEAEPGEPSEQSPSDGGATASSP